MVRETLNHHCCHFDLVNVVCDVDDGDLVHVHLVADVEVGDVGGNHWLPFKVCHTLQNYDDTDDDAVEDDDDNDDNDDNDDDDDDNNDN